MPKNNFPCTCGHEADDHFLDDDGQMASLDETKARCLFCYIDGDFDRDGCTGYKADNLKYLEIMLERS
jgi:hypothetical protein